FLKCAITSDHSTILLNIKVIFASFLRPVNKSALPLINNGAVGKNIFAHGKSSEYPIVNGLIPMHSAISKAGKNDDLTRIEKYDKENDHSVENSDEVLDRVEKKIKSKWSELSPKEKEDPEKYHDKILAKAGLSAELFEELVQPVDLLDKNSNQIYFFKDKKGLAFRDQDTREPVFAIKDKEGNYIQIDGNHESMGSIIPNDYEPVAIQVLGKPVMEITKNGDLKVKEVKPLTADIDVLAYGTKIDIENYNTISHKEMTKAAREKILQNPDYDKLFSGFKSILISKSIDKVPRVVKYFIKKSLGQKKSQELLETLKKEKILKQHLHGMGEGAEISHAITGHMRAEFKNTEISHGAEQFNLRFTQPMGDNWVVVDPKGKVSVIKTEEELLKTFNKFRDEGLSMPPNPKWGWKLEENGYVIDQEQKALFDKITNAKNTIDKKASAKQKKHLQKLVDTKLKLGILSVTTPIEYIREQGKKDNKPRKSKAELDQEIKSTKNKLNELMESYSKKYPVIDESKKWNIKNYSFKKTKNKIKGIKNVLKKYKGNIKSSLQAINLKAKNKQQSPRRH
ncbi:MAG: hypothetical protein HRU35_06875, partial [Rickettsiaceae bacterium]|nr:hypothetical protein [Rickettsiaceae bacterium]